MRQRREMVGNGVAVEGGDELGVMRDREWMVFRKDDRKIRKGNNHSSRSALELQLPLRRRGVTWSIVLGKISRVFDDDRWNPVLKLASDFWKRLFPARSRRSSAVLIPPRIGLGRRLNSTTSMDLNFFKLCSGLKFLGYFMIVLVAAIIAASYYAVVVITWGPQLLQGAFKSFLSFTIIAVFHVLLILLLWCYFMVVFCDPGSVPENWKPVVEEGTSMPLSDFGVPENLASTLSSSDGMERIPAVGYCSHCENGKPPRCHHCSVCQRCVLKMDHHCVWVVNCVGARNYKFFLLFLVYEKKNAVRWKYDFGQKNNFEQVFGTSKALWFFPLFSKEDLENIPALHGLDFPTHPDVEA
ncbi:DHHC-type zinc finger family protein [Actinidia rufa]|uniref:S-acyltransferase n=1 Tax=Actinidia rufa TaxID=165716 RepID=A0A7J0E4Y9_9ERIC|nr:DHHC-type zinc finger family protein [Actinidia rufa]